MFSLLDFFFSYSKDSDANIGMIAILVHFEKNSIGFSIDFNVKRNYIQKFVLMKAATLFVQNLKKKWHDGPPETASFVIIEIT